MRSSVDVALGDLARVLDTLAVDWFLFGAQAAIIYGSTRVTEDIDVTVDLRDLPTRKLVSTLKRAGFGLRVQDSGRFVETTRVLPVVHLATSMPVDIVLAGPGLEELFISRLRRHRRGARLIPVASPEDLVVMKLLAGRPRDLDDVRSVLRALGPALDMQTIVATLELLEEALDQDDLLPVLAQLRTDTAAPSKSTPAKKVSRRAAKSTEAPRARAKSGAKKRRS